MHNLYEMLNQKKSTVDVPNSGRKSPMFENAMYVVRCSSKNGYQKDMFERVRLHAQNP